MGAQRDSQAKRRERAAPVTTGLALPIGLGIALVGLVVVAFLPAFGAQFLNFDDDKLYTLSYRWRGLDAARLRWMFGTTQMGHYQPLTWLSVALDYAVHGLTPPAYPEAAGYHATSVGLHAAAALALFALAARLLQLAAPQWNTRTRLITAAGAAAIWAVHPLRVESVVWLTERRDVLSAPFFFLALYAWLGWAAPGRASARAASLEPAAMALCGVAGVAWWTGLDLSTPTQVSIASPTFLALGGLAWGAALTVLAHGSGRGPWLGLCAACMLLSLLSKAWAMVLPALFVVVDCWPLRRIAVVPARTLVAEKLPFVVLALLFARLAHAAQAGALGVVATWSAHPLTARIAQAAYGLLYYPAKTIAPFHLQPLYPLPRDLALLEPRWLLAVSAAAALAAALIAARRRAPAVAAACAAYAVVVAPVLGFLQSGPQLVADRYAYLAGAPFALLLAAGLAWRGIPRRLGIAIGCAALLALSAATYRQATFWRTSTTLWERAYALDPDNPAVLIALGTLRTQRAQTEPDPVRARALLDEAAAMQQRAFALDGSPLALRNLSQAETMLSLVDGARDHEHKRAALDYARHAVELATAQQRLSADYLHAYGIDLINVGDLDAAVAQLSRAAAMDPDAIRILVNLGHALRRAGRPDEALPPLERAVRLEPRDTRAWAELATAHEARGQRADALAAWRRVLALMPDDPAAKARVSALAAGA